MRGADGESRRLWQMGAQYSCGGENPYTDLDLCEDIYNFEFCQFLSEIDDMILYLYFGTASKECAMCPLTCS